MAIKLQDLQIDIHSMFKDDVLLICEGHPFQKYVDGVKTDDIGGVTYECVNTGMNYEKVSVKVRGETKPSIQYEGTPIKVIFEGLEGKAYQDFRHGGEIKLSLSASAILRADTKTTLKINKDVN